MVAAKNTRAANGKGDRLVLEQPYAPEALAELVKRFGSPLLILDCAVLRQQYRALAEALPGVDLHYALKPWPERAVVETLAAEGGWFDLATTGEVELVRQAGIDPARCIHTHPIKRDADIRAALDYGVRTFVADNPDELRKFEPYRERVELLDLAQELGLRIAGLSFHVGSQSLVPTTKVRAIKACAEILKSHAGKGIATPATLDIGGGFPIDYLEPAPPIDEFCAPIRRALAAVPEGTRLIAEPGRFIAGPAGTVLTTVMGRAWRDALWWYYLDDGLYGSFSGQLYDHAHYPVEPLVWPPGKRIHSVLAGPTCDSIDVIAEDVLLPELQIGDVLIGRQMGAYTAASATDFNFFPRARLLVANR